MSTDPTNEWFGPADSQGDGAGFPPTADELAEQNEREDHENNGWGLPDGVEQQGSKETRKTLLDIGEEMLLIEDAFDALENGDIEDDGFEDYLDRVLDSTLMDLEKKLDDYCALIKEKESRVNVRKEEVNRMQALYRSDRNLAEKLKDRLHDFLVRMGIYDKIDTPRYRVGLNKKGGRLPVIVHDDVDARDLPERFQKVSVRPDKTAIREAIKNGESITVPAVDEEKIIDDVQSGELDDDADWFDLTTFQGVTDLEITGDVPEEYMTEKVAAHLGERGYYVSIR